MGIVTEKKFLTQEELNVLKSLQQETQAIIMELGEIEMIKLQIGNRYESVKEFISELSSKEKEFHQSVFNKYGKSSVNPETGEITQVD
jgi:hypothetical protein